MAAVIRISGDNPTLTHVALAMNETMGTNLNASDIARAVHARGLSSSMKDGRVSADALPNIFYELRVSHNVKLCNPDSLDVVSA